MLFRITIPQDAIANLVAFHDVGDFTSAQAIRAPGRLACWRVTTSRGSYLLRMVAQPTFWDMVHEKDLLLHLAERAGELGALAIPRMVKNAAGGYFIPMGDAYVSIFPTLEGRELGVFEITPDACAQVGEALARFHLAARDFHGRKRHPARPRVLRRLCAAVPLHRLELREVAAVLHREQAFLRGARGRLTVGGTIHGGLGPDAARFRGGQLCALTRFESAGRGALVQDLAACLIAWGWDRTAFDPARCQALVRSYARVRALTDAERSTLHAQARLAAAQQTATCILEHELEGASDVPYQSYEHPFRRLQALRALGRRAFRDLVGAAA
ncbi:MAG: hypothetical protein AB2A00_20205 [Myxococcota bacterium]